MKLIEQLPHLGVSSDEEILDSFSSIYMKEVMPELTEYYNSKLAMSRVLAIRGIYLPPGVDQMQIHCPLPSHGEDVHPSCRYYYRDRETDKVHEQIYCFKCNQVHSAFSLICAIQRGQGMRFRQTLLFIRDRLGVPLPRQIFFQLDLDKMMRGESSQTSKQSPKYYERVVSIARAIREEQDIPTFLNRLRRFYPYMMSEQFLEDLKDGNQ